MNLLYREWPPFSQFTLVVEVRNEDRCALVFRRLQWFHLCWEVGGRPAFLISTAVAILSRTLILFWLCSTYRCIMSLTVKAMSLTVLSRLELLASPWHIGCGVVSFPEGGSGSWYFVFSLCTVAFFKLRGNVVLMLGPKGGLTEAPSRGSVNRTGVKGATK